MELSENAAVRLWWIQPTAKTSAIAQSHTRAASLIAVLIAALHAFMAVTATNTKSPTFDEPQHLTAGFSYWIRNDFRLDPENGNLPARWAAIPLLFGNTQFVSPHDTDWQQADEGKTAHQFLYELGNDPARMIAQARLMMSFFGLALCLLVYRIAREFFGVLGALIAETLIAFDPNFLAHSALVTSDVPAAFFFTAAIWSCWRLFQEISPARFAMAALNLSGLFLTKFSAPILLPVVGTVSLLQIASPSGIAVCSCRIRVQFIEKWQKTCAIAATWLLLAITIVFAIWLSFSFRYAAWSDNILGHDEDGWQWSYVLENHGALENAISFARVHHLLPEGYLYGLAYVQKHEDDRPAFLDNHWSLVGFSSFFPLAFLYKTPLPLLCLTLLALGTALTKRDRWRSSILQFFLFVLVYAAFAFRTQLNIGHRHILPIYPALFIGCGAITLLLQKRLRIVFAGAIAVLLCWEVWESLAVRPNYLAYFNQIAGGPKNGYQHLVDSSLDWGQDLPDLKSWLDDHASIVNKKPTYLGYFGAADPAWYGIDAKRVPENHPSGDQTLEKLRGGIYCVSATTLQSVYAREIGPWSRDYEQQYQTTLAQLEPDRAVAARIANDGAASWEKVRIFERLRFERLCAYLRHRSIDAQIGYSIFIFNLTDDEVDHALYGTPAELTREVRAAGY